MKCKGCSYLKIGYEDDNDYERDAFYALTDGMYGDYDEWCESSGDIDLLMESLGY